MAKQDYQQLIDMLEAFEYFYKTIESGINNKYLKIMEEIKNDFDNFDESVLSEDPKAKELFAKVLNSRGNRLIKILLEK